MNANKEPPYVEAVADDRFAVAVRNTAEGQRLARRLSTLPGCIDAVGGVAVVECRFDLAAVAAEQFLNDLERVVRAQAGATVETAAGSEGRRHVLTVHYGGEDGPDLEAVAKQLGLSADELVARHTGGEHRVALLGFTPGFAYLDGAGFGREVPRRPDPRQFVPAGSLGVAGQRSGIYPLPGPGGWQIIGRTDAVLFDPGEEEPFLLSPGDTVVFRRADR